MPLNKANQMIKDSEKECAKLMMEKTMGRKNWDKPIIEYIKVKSDTERSTSKGNNWDLKKSIEHAQRI